MKNRTPEHQRFEDAVASLPQVRDGMPEDQWRQPRHWWFVNATFGSPGSDIDERARVYHLECTLGRGLGDNFVQVIRRYPELTHMLLNSTLKDMVAVGKLTGVEIAFLEAVAEALVLRRSDLSIVKAGQPDVNGTYA